MLVRYVGLEPTAQPGYPAWTPGEEREVTPEHAAKLCTRSDFLLIKTVAGPVLATESPTTSEVDAAAPARVEEGYPEPNN